MNGSLTQVSTLLEGIKQGASDLAEIDILVCPTFVHLAQAKTLLAQSGILLGAQNLYLGSHGAYTGEIAGNMLAEMGCQYVLVGHSERRSIFLESLIVVAEKFDAALKAGLKPILCVGETQVERENDLTETVLREQLESVIQLVGIEAFRQAVIAYEPVWAIGTGLTATPAKAQAAHVFIRQLIAQNNVDIAQTIRILYR